MAEQENKVLDLTEEMPAENQLVLPPQKRSEDLLSEVVRAASPEAKEAAVAQAVNSALPENKVNVVGEAVEQLSYQQQKEIASRFLPSREAADKVWMMIVRSFAAVLVIAMVGLVGIVFLSTFRKVDENLVQIMVQIMLTVFLTTAGILVGFIAGHAAGASSSR